MRPVPPSPSWIDWSTVRSSLVLSLVGDALLLSERTAAFLAGLGAFLLAHAAYSVAFAWAGVSLPALAGAAVAAVALGAGVLRWLGPGLGPSYRGPVVAYVAVILIMVSLAVGHAAHSGRWGVAVGALVFAASDLAVARQKFVRAAFVNKAWGLPAYYVAQWMLAGSVAA